MNRIPCLRDVNFKERYFNVSKLTLEQKETGAVFHHATLLTKMDRRHKMTKCKAKFCRLKESTKNY